VSRYSDWHRTSRSPVGIFWNISSYTSPYSAKRIHMIYVIRAYTVSEEEELFPTSQNFRYYASLEKREKYD
jgi:hypothetical protein